MGSSSRSQSSQATENNSTTFGIQGDNSGLVLNGSGNQITDGGAFDIIGQFVDILPSILSQGAGMVTDGFNAVTDVALMGERQNEHLLNTADSLFGEVSDTQQYMMELGAGVLSDTAQTLENSQERAFDFAGNALSDTTRLLENSQDAAFDFAGNVTSDAMASVSDIADSAIFANLEATQAAMKGNNDLALVVAGALENANNNNTHLAESLTTQALDSNNEAAETAMGQLQRGFDSMMSFADDFSRSDGAAIAESNNKTMLYMMGGTVLIAGALIFAGRK
ncbi:hypothetical protein G3R49_19730 [Shewanella sp. WXL01]|uniref:hypothetical protein n=1 Tax=Shewanella sp. WXL01 TaxID=2709721 RepID=UPI00143827FD|nr:hypothetical protein [Shewanella sp. WXL01]NKF52791.1 hypothetical protein [Shewanella sp. WXL01]